MKQRRSDVEQAAAPDPTVGVDAFAGNRQHPERRVPRGVAAAGRLAGGPVIPRAEAVVGEEQDVRLVAGQL